MSDWLNNSLQMYAEYESPIRYNYWALLSAVSAILKDKVYLDKFRYKLYPNIYVLLYGPSAVKKGPPVALAKSIVTKVDNTRVINGRATVEAIMKELGTVRGRQNKPPINDSAGFIVSSELSSSIIGNSSSLDILTDLFDRIYNQGEWTYRTKNSDPIRLKNPTVTWLAASNEALFREFVPEKNLKGGLIGRTFIISETKENVINSLMNCPSIIPDEQKVADGIKHIQNLAGPFKMSDEVRQAFDSWYVHFKTNIAPTLEDDTGTVGRTDDNILRLAMLISSARRGDLELKIDDIEEAMKEVLPLIVPARKISQNEASKEISIVGKRVIVIQYLAKKEDFREERTELLRKLTMKMDHEDLDRIVIFLEQAGVLYQTKDGSKTFYGLNMRNDKVKEYVENFGK